MLWIILFVLCLILAILTNDEGGFSIFSLLFFIVVIVAMCVGISDYPSLLGQKEEITVLKERISDIRSATYETKSISKSAIVSGSIENMEQSKILSESIQYLAKAEAKYNSDLKEIQYYEDSSVFYWLWHGIFISSEVQKLNPVVIDKLK